MSKEGRRAAMHRAAFDRWQAALADYPDHTVEGMLLRDPLRMLRELRKAEDQAVRDLQQMLEVDDLLLRLFDALNTPVTRNEKRELTPAAQRFIIRRLFAKGWNQAEIARRLRCSWMTVHRHVEGMPRRP